MTRSVAVGHRISLAVAAAGTLVLGAWFVGYRPLVQLVPTSPLSQLWTVLLLVTLSLLAVGSQLRSPRWFGVLWHVLAAAVILVAVLFVVEHLDGADFGLTLLWPLDRSPLTGELSRPSLASCAAVILLAVAVVQARHGGGRVTQPLAIGAILLALFSLNGYALGAQSALRIGRYENMAFGSAVLVLVLGYALIDLTAVDGPLRLVAGQEDAGALLRRLIPGVVLGLLAVAAVAGVVITQSGVHYTLVFGLGLTVAMFLVSALIFRQAMALRRVDARRSGAEQALEVVRELMHARDELTRQLDEQSRALRQIIETSPDAFVAMDEAGRVTSWNPAAEAIFGWTSDEVVGQPLHRLIVPDFEDWMAHGGDFPARVGSIEAFQARAKDVDSVRKDGSRVRVDLTLWPASEEPSRAYYAFARDVTARRDSEERLLEANADLREFAAIAAHDLRNPLVAIRLAAEMLADSTKDGAVDEQAREWIGRIQGATLRGQELISDLLEYSSLTSGPRETSRIDLTRLVEEVADHVALSTDRKFSVELEPLPVIEGDLPRLRQLFANLFGNAAKYVPRDRPAVVHVTALTGRRVVRIMIADNGDGVADADKATVFGAFQRGSANRDTPGTGIGLAICRKVVERHGGTIRVEDSESGGACFVIELPRWPGAMTIGLGGDVPTSLASGHGL